LIPKSDTPTGPDIEESSATETSTNPIPESAVGFNSCSLCGVTSHTVEDQKNHVRSDFHGYNLKQRIRGVKPVSEADFEKLVGGMLRYLLPKQAFIFAQISTKVCQAPTRPIPKMMKMELLVKRPV
jgi:hypothetical protein